MQPLTIDAVILHYILTEKKYMLEVSKSVRSAYFDGLYQGFFALLHSAFLDPSIKEVLSEVAFLDYCSRKGVGNQLANYKTLYGDLLALTIDGQPPKASDFPYYLQRLKEKYNAKVAESAMKSISDALSSGKDVREINQIYTDAVKEIASIHKGKVFDEGSLGDDVVNMFKEYEHIKEAPELFRGITTGITAIDNLTNGFFGGELIVIAGMEGTGKSTLAMNMAVGAWLGTNRELWFDPDYKRTEGILDNYSLTGKNVVYFSLEMPRSNRGKFSSAAYLNKRLISCISGLEFSQIRKGTLSDIDFERFRLACKFVKKYDKDCKFYVVDIPRGATIDDLEVKLLEIQDKFPVHLVVVDYIGLMAGAENEEDWKELGHIAEQMHELCRVYDIPIITPSQVNRPQGAGQSLNKQSYNTTRLARSAMLSQNANIIFQIGSRDQEEQYNDMPIYIIKMRDAPRGILTLNKDFSRMRVYDSISIEDSLSGLSSIIDLGNDEESNDHSN